MAPIYRWREQPVFRLDGGDKQGFLRDYWGSVGDQTGASGRLTISGPPSEKFAVQDTLANYNAEDFGLSYVTLRDHAFTVAGGVVEKAQRTAKPSNIHWRITSVSGAREVICDHRGGSSWGFGVYVVYGVSVSICARRPC